MQRNPAGRGRFRALCTAAGAVLGAAMQRSQTLQWQGCSCLSRTAAGVPSATWGSAAGFGAAVATTGGTARRRPARIDQEPRSPGA